MYPLTRRAVELMVLRLRGDAAKDITLLALQRTEVTNRFTEQHPRPSLAC
jgi:hypothetical protein